MNTLNNFYQNSTTPHTPNPNFCIQISKSYILERQHLHIFLIGLRMMQGWKRVLVPQLRSLLQVPFNEESIRASSTNYIIM